MAVDPKSPTAEEQEKINRQQKLKQAFAFRTPASQEGGGGDPADSCPARSSASGNGLDHSPSSGAAGRYRLRHP